MDVKTSVLASNGNPESNLRIALTKTVAPSFDRLQDNIQEQQPN